MRLRQCVLVARELDAVEADLFAVLGVDDAFRDPSVGKFGLRNIVIPIGDTYLEVVCPREPNTTAGRFIERIGGDGGYMLIVQVEDLAIERQRVEKLGVRIVWGVDNEAASAIHLHPKDVGGAILSLDEMRPPESWLWAGPGWQQRKAKLAHTITSAALFSWDPRSLQKRWREVLGEREPEHAALGFESDPQGRGDRVGAIAIEVGDLDRVLSIAKSRGLPVEEQRVTICGTEFRFHE